jgi:hypothetical protein
MEHENKIFYSYSQPAILSETPPHPRLMPPLLFASLVARLMRRSLNDHHSRTAGISYPIHGKERHISACCLGFRWRQGWRQGWNQASVKREWLCTDTDVEGGRSIWERWWNARDPWLRDFCHTAAVMIGIIGCDGRMGRVGWATWCIHGCVVQL